MEGDSISKLVQELQQLKLRVEEIESELRKKADPGKQEQKGKEETPRANAGGKDGAAPAAGVVHTSGECLVQLVPSRSFFVWDTFAGIHTAVAWLEVSAACDTELTSASSFVAMPKHLVFHQTSSKNNSSVIHVLSSA